jgi:hypothetical protein
MVLFPGTNAEREIRLCYFYRRGGSAAEPGSVKEEKKGGRLGGSAAQA